MIAFGSNYGPRGPREIWVMDSNGGNERKLLDTDQDSSIQVARWSPDDQRLVYLKSPVASGKQEDALEVRDLKGGPAITVLSSRWLRDHLWLPDGRLLYALAAE